MTGRTIGRTVLADRIRNFIAAQTDSEGGQYLFAIKQLVSREVKRKYARSYLGIVWSVLNPLMSMAVMSMIFSTIFKRSIENFPIYYLTGIIFWNLFSGTTNSAMTALVDNRTMLMKVKLSKQTFVIARMFTALTNFGYTCVAYVLMLIIFRVRPNPYMLLFPINVLFIMLFSAGVGFMLSVFYVFFADIQYLYSVLLTLWMYMSAIFYPVNNLSTAMQWIIRKNPVYNYIEFARDIVLYGIMPEPVLWLKIIGWGILSFTVGYLIFKKKEDLVMQRL
ncbi:MAG: ABC transporter permease [Butyrivibrio sp.]|nr:ABC transporter permease [Acetatifactor muris]MCM1561546.1 ABC transporter permease [Butyrivibrio sp.]